MISDWGLLARFVLALTVVLALIAAATWAARRYMGSAMMAGLTGRRRLAVVESTMLDGKSRLVLVRRDSTEHLLVLGPTGAAVVESGIAAAPVASAPPDEATRTRMTDTP